MADDAGGAGRVVRRRLREMVCPDCDHPWDEHPGGLAGAEDVCGECVYEREHGQAPIDRAPCRLAVPDAMFARATPRELKRARPLSRRLGDGIGRGVARVVDALLDAWP